MSKLNLKVFPLGPYATNCYLLWPDGDKRAWLVDASFGPMPILEFIKAQGLLVEKLILTHAHVDHIHGVREVLAALTPRPELLIHEAEKEWLSDPEINLSDEYGDPTTTPPADTLLKHGDTLSLADHVFTVMHLPGHSPGGIALYSAANKLAISGDTIFNKSIGRADLPGGDMDALANSIRTRIYTLPGETTLHPGHSTSTTVASEMAGNPYVRP